MNTKAKCQSCGMPLKADPGHGGTNADGSHSDEYCSYCYANGRFFQPEMTIDQMKALVVAKLREKGFPGFVARFFASGLRNLKRWR
ncbi:MAG: zinc ribbon domain-containing protein [bacterium]|nr:zinc ribbon domain-containing protein [bacterium]